MVYSNILLNCIYQFFHFRIIKLFFCCLDYAAIPYLWDVNMRKETGNQNVKRYREMQVAVELSLTWWRTVFLVYQCTSIVLPPLSEANPTCRGCISKVTKSQSVYHWTFSNIEFKFVEKEQEICIFWKSISTLSNSFYNFFSNFTCMYTLRIAPAYIGWIRISFDPTWIGDVPH